jgi:dihydrofolate reductase
MAKVVVNASMSLDGYVAKRDNTIGRLFDWLQNGEEEIAASESMTVRLTPQSAAYWRRWMSQVGALVCGRTLFDVTDGWGGRHNPFDIPVVVVTHEVPADWVAAHPDAPFSFVTSGVREAIEQARAIAGDRTVAVTGGTIARQCLELGLLDEVAVDLVPVVMGTGRPFFGELAREDILLGDATVCIQGKQVTHLVFPVKRSEPA